MKKILLIMLGSLVSIIFCIALVGMYKFNVLQDDVFFSGVGMSMDDKELFIGNWVEPIPGAPKKVQGFTLNEDGSASSINMATLLYKSWKINNGKLILTSKSIGNGSSSIGDDEYKIELVGKKRLYLGRGETTFIYKKQR